MLPGKLNHSSRCVKVEIATGHTVEKAGLRGKVPAGSINLDSSAGSQSHEHGGEPQK